MERVKTLGSLIDELNKLREQRRLLVEQDKKLSAAYDAVELLVKERLIAEGMDKATGRAATASLSYVTVATVTDWQKVYALIKKTGAFHLLQRRVSDPAFRELYEMEFVKLAKKRGVKAETIDPASVVPGFEPFVKLNLNLTALKVAA